jgi:hypothetical protein
MMFTEVVCVGLILIDSIEMIMITYLFLVRQRAGRNCKSVWCDSTVTISTKTQLPLESDTTVKIVATYLLFVNLDEIDNEGRFHQTFLQCKMFLAHCVFIKKIAIQFHQHSASKYAAKVIRFMT